MAIFLCLLLIAGSTGFAQDAATVPGVFAGTSVKIVERMGDPVLRPGEIAECILNADGRFRFAALRPGGNSIWTRGSWTMERCDAAGADVSFRCDDISGTLTGRREGDELYLKFSPHPLETLAFRMKLRAPVAAPGDGWSEHAGKPATLASVPGVYGGAFLASKRTDKRGTDEIGTVLLILGPSGTVAGAILAPAPGGSDSTAILCPVGGAWRLSGDRLVIRPAWGRPGPPAAWRNMSVQISVAGKGPVLEGLTSLGGVPTDGCRLEKIAHWPANALDVQVPLVLSRIGALTQAGDGKGDSAIRFPVRVSADRRLLYVRAIDDSQTWLPFPMMVGKDGAIRVNEDGRCGYLVRGDDGGVDAFLVTTLRPSVRGSAASFMFPDETGNDEPVELPATCIGPLWVFTLDIHRRPLDRRSGGAGFRRLTAAALAGPERPVEAGTKNK
ncbi:MAG TPA: hypothetical protein PLU72_00760 [Candidatus Ozemobacteraceae bacterium]|nr:hypothetical protein [Candidatus Ozemobacteraceae bacterium]